MTFRPQFIFFNLFLLALARSAQASLYESFDLLNPTQGWQPVISEALGRNELERSFLIQSFKDPRIEEISLGLEGQGYQSIWRRLDQPVEENHSRVEPSSGPTASLFHLREGQDATAIKFIAKAKTFNGMTVTLNPKSTTPNLSPINRLEKRIWGALCRYLSQREIVGRLKLSSASISKLLEREEVQAVARKEKVNDPIVFKSYLDYLNKKEQGIFTSQAELDFLDSQDMLQFLKDEEAHKIFTDITTFSSSAGNDSSDSHDSWSQLTEGNLNDLLNSSGTFKHLKSLTIRQWPQSQSLMSLEMLGRYLSSIESLSQLTLVIPNSHLDEVSTEWLVFLNSFLTSPESSLKKVTIVNAVFSSKDARHLEFLLQAKNHPQRFAFRNCTLRLDTHQEIDLNSLAQFLNELNFDLRVEIYSNYQSIPETWLNFLDALYCSDASQKRELTLVLASFDQAMIAKLNSLLVENSNLIGLNLDNCSIAKDLFPQLQTGIQNSRSLETLECYVLIPLGPGIQSNSDERAEDIKSAFRPIAEAVIASPSLKKVRLRCTGDERTQEDLRSIAETIRSARPELSVE